MLENASKKLAKPSGGLASSSSSSSSSISIKKDTPSEPAKAGGTSEPFKLLSSYKDCFLNKYGKEYKPTNEDKDFGILKRAISWAGGFSEAQELMIKFFDIKDEWLSDNAYPLEYFIKYLNKIRVKGEEKNELKKVFDLAFGRVKDDRS